ncbi:MAG: hypothetical protein HYR89_03525 [Actinobacteria bacterium]|nr:hypothetical protein [Actinomycetota bacterium]
MRSRRFRVIALASVVLGAAVTFGVLQFTDDDGCTRRITSYDRTAGPGGPQSADEALEKFLATGATGSAAEGLAVDDLTVVGTQPSLVVYQTDDGGVDVVVTKLAGGWFVGEASGTC